MLTIYCFIQSTGPYVVSWSLKKIRLGQIYNYVIKKYDDIVVSDNFVYGNDNNIIVAVSIINSLSILTCKIFHTHVLPALLLFPASKRCHHLVQETTGNTKKYLDYTIQKLALTL